MVEGKIYKISNTVNNKVYIGQTIQSLSTRFSRHKQTKEIINIFDNAKDAERSINLVGIGVNRALNSNKNDGSPRTAGGFIWKKISAKDLTMIEEQQEIEKIIDNES